MFPNWFETQAHFFERNVPTAPLRALQIGAYTGDATEWLLNNREVVFLDDVDTWEGSQETAHETIDFSEVESYYMDRFGEDDRVVSHKMTSDAFFYAVKGTYNFIYIDGDHTAVQVALDAFNAWRLLEPGGVMGFDDYEWWDNPDEYLRPKRGIDAFLLACAGKYQIIDQGYQLWIKKL